jgi:molecular chaperone DnaK
MVKDADAHSAEDKKRREIIDVKNQADQMVYNLEKLLRENKEKIPADEASKVQTEIDNTKKAAEGEDAEAIKQAMEKLSQVSHKLTEMMYQEATQQQQAQQQAGGPQEAAGEQAQSQEQEAAEEEVIDAEVVDEDKK